MAIIRFSAMGAKVIRNVAIERLKAAAEQMPNKHEPVRCNPSVTPADAASLCSGHAPRRTPACHLRSGLCSHRIRFKIL